MIDQITNEIILASQVLKTNSVSTIAEKLGYQPMLILNALFEGQRKGKLVYVKKRDIIKIHADVELEALAITDGLAESREQIELFIANENSLEVDMSFDELRSFLPMLPELHMQLALLTSKKLASYMITDPADKDSKYEFWTLKENADKRWGEKQFDSSNSKAKRHANGSKSSKN